MQEPQKEGSAPINVNLRGVNSQNLLDDADNDGEGLVDLPQSNVLWLQAGLFQSDGNRDGGCLREVLRLHTTISIC